VDGWITFWAIACIVGFASFYVLVAAAAIPGARDLFRLFRHLAEGSERHPDSDDAG